MTTTQHDPKAYPETAIYHDVEIVDGGGMPVETYGEIKRETLTLRVSTEWRGKAATIDIVADRYRHSSGLSDWRVIGTNAREDLGGNGLGAPLTDTARTRLADAHKHLAHDYLATEAYRESLATAMFYAIRGMLRDAGGHPGLYSAKPSRDARRAIDKAVKAGQLGPETVDKLLSAADALDTYAALVTS